MAFAGWSYNANGGTISYANSCLFITGDGGANFYPPLEGGHAINTAYTSVQIVKNSNNVREYRMILNKVYNTDNNIAAEIYYSVYDGSTIAEHKIDNFASGNSIYTGSGIKFQNANTGYLSAQGKIYKTNNAGNNWSLDYSSGLTDPNFYMKLSIVGDIVYNGTPFGPVAVKRLNTNLLSYLDNSVSIASMKIDGITFSTSGTSYVQGGNVVLESNEYINQNDAVFYKWGDNSTSITNSASFTTNNNTFSNTYKTKQYSTTPAAISNPNSTKTIKDTVLSNEHRVHQVHESMGGIFYTKSTNNGVSFNTEEVVNRTLTGNLAEGNKNPAVSLCRTFSSTKPLIYYSGTNPALKDKDVAVTWERYNSGTQKNEIKVARRNSNNNWDIYSDGISGHTQVCKTFSAVPEYESKPKIFSLSTITGPTINNTFFLIPHLEPASNGNKIVVTAAYLTLNGDYVIDEGNITDFAVTAPYNSSFAEFNLYFTYKKDGKIYYKNITIGYYENHFYAVNISTPLEISAGDANTARHTPDISLRNGLPIVTYQGILPMTRVYSIEEVSSSPGLTETHTVQFTQYPIMVTYLKPDLTGWSNPTAQPSSGTIVQSDPNIEGSATGNGYILSFRKGNLGYYQYSNLQNYHCDPPAFLGTDAKLVRGSYSTPLGGALLTTLTSENSLYKLGKQNVAITNVNSQIQDGVYGNIKGVVNMNDIDYVFNMGPIFVATGPQVDMPLFGDALNEVTPITGIEFNEYLRSEPFALNNGDTLVLGATANYIAVDKQDFYPMKYTVNLMNANTQEVSKVLFSDTIHIEDEEMTEYYRGFVFSDLNPEDGNVYLQIMVEDVSNTDAKYNYVGIYQGESEVQDRNGRIDPTNGVFVDFGRSRNLSNELTVKPTSYSITQNYPNPFNPITTIRYSLPNDGLVQIRVYDLSGKEVVNLVNENKVAGNYEVKFNGANLSSGIYFYRINAGEFVQTKRMVLVK